MGGPQAALGTPGHRRLRLGFERRADRARGRHGLWRAPAGPLRARPPRAAARITRPGAGTGRPVQSVRAGVQRRRRRRATHLDLGRGGAPPGFRRRAYAVGLPGATAPSRAIPKLPRDPTARMIRNIAAYHFVEIADPQLLAGRIREWAEAAALLGTVLVAPEGINLFLAGADAAIEGFLDHLRRDPRFAGITVKDSWSATVPFARLKVKRKREIISFRRDDASPLAGR